MSTSTVRLIDFDDPSPSANQWMISTEVTFTRAASRRRFDLVLWCNGFPLVVGEAKTPVRPAYTWIDGAAQVHEDYEKNVPQFFVPNVFSFATEGKDFRYGTVGMPVELWGPWREEETDPDARRRSGLQPSGRRSTACSSPAAVLDFLRFFTVYRHRQEAPQDQDHRPVTSSSRRPT